MARHKDQSSGEKRNSGLRDSIAGFGLDGVQKLKEGVRAEVIGIFDVTDSRMRTVIEDIVEGSSPRLLYYTLMCISALIAGIGLLFNSPAVVIGAMLISPLMTPIFGISLGLIRGDFGLVRTALVSEIGGMSERRTGRVSSSRGRTARLAPCRPRSGLLVAAARRALLTEDR